MHVLIREIYMLHYERKENHVLVMAFTRCVRENVPLLQQYSRTHTFLFYFYFFSNGELIFLQEGIKKYETNKPNKFERYSRSYR